MAKSIPAAIMDLMLDQCEGDTIYVCRGEPADFSDLVNSTGNGTTGGLTLASGGIGTITAGTSGTNRNNTYGTVGGMTIVDTAEATHVALSVGGTTLTLVTTCTNQNLTSGGTVDTSAFVHTLANPV